MAHSRSLDAAPFFDEIGFLFGARLIESACADEMNDAVQLVDLKPGSVLAADIDDYSGTTREVHAMHQVVALGTTNISNGADQVCTRDRLCAAKNGGLLLCIPANPLER